jgi:hypothetical protein
MRERSLTVPEIMLIAGTRVVLGAGLGVLIGDKLSHDARQGAGWALLAVAESRRSRLSWMYFASLSLQNGLDVLGIQGGCAHLNYSQSRHER